MDNLIQLSQLKWKRKRGSSIHIYGPSRTPEHAGYIIDLIWHTDRKAAEHCTCSRNCLVLTLRSAHKT